MNDIEIEADRLHGLYAGSCRPEEYEHLIAAGLLRLRYEGVGGFLGLAKLVRVEPERAHPDE